MSLRLVHLSDTHFGFEDRGAIEAASAMTLDLAPDLTLVTGDLTLAGRPAEFLAARAWLDRLPRPVLATPGNHDTPYWNLVLRSLTPFDRWRRFIGADERVAFESPGLAAYALNTARGAQLRPNWALGAISPTAVDENPSLEGSNVCAGSRHSPNRAQLERTSSSSRDDRADV